MQLLLEVIEIVCDFANQLLENGQVFTWGENAYGQLCLGNIAEQTAPILVGDQLLSASIVSAAGGTQHTLLVSNTGQLYGCGNNNYNQIGTGGQANSPKAITTPYAVQACAAGSSHSIILTSKNFLSNCCGKCQLTHP